jgi:hypothetical protein
VVDGLDLDVSAGEIVGLIGTNGAGKTNSTMILWRPWLLFRSAARLPAAHTTWMPRSRRSCDMNAASTPYVGRPQGPAAGLMRPVGQEMLPWPTPTPRRDADEPTGHGYGRIGRTTRRTLSLTRS